MTAAATLPSPAPGADFPSWLPPMLVKELRQGLRARSFVSGMVTIHTGMALLLGWVLLHPGRELAGAAEAVRGALWFIAAALLLLLTPRRAEGLGAELKERTLDPLLLTQLDGTRIVLSKWASLLAQAALVVVALLPYGLLQYFVGEMDVLRDMTTLAALVFGSAVLTAVALMFSTLARWQTMVVGLAGGCLLFLGPLFIFVFKVVSAPAASTFLLLPATGTLVAMAIYDAALGAVLSLVLAAWRLDRCNRSRAAWRTVLLAFPAAGVVALSSGWLALAQGGFCLAMLLVLFVARPRRNKPRRAAMSAAVAASAAETGLPRSSTAAQSLAAKATTQFKFVADFPVCVPPMLVKELRQGLRTRAFVAAFILAQVAMAGTFFYAGFSTRNTSAASALADGFYWAVMGGVLVLLAPLRARGALGKEIMERTTDLLLLTHLTGWRIVTGKWVSLMTQTLLLAVSLLPFGLLRYYLGGTELYADFWRLASFLFAGGVLTAMQILASVTRLGQRILIIICGLFSLIPFGFVFASIDHMAINRTLVPIAGLMVLVCDIVLLAVQCLVSAGGIVDPQRATNKPTRIIALLAIIPGALAMPASIGFLLGQIVVALLLAGFAGSLMPYRSSPSSWTPPISTQPNGKVPSRSNETPP
jgi:hypothetical protein